VPLKKLYSTYHITNPGEQKTSSRLDLELWGHPKQWQLIHSLLRGKSKTDSAGECDFILIGERGIVVLEVKGSQWKSEGNRFKMKHKEDWIEKDSPFLQARNNKAALIEILNKNKIWDILVTHAVVFAECTFPLKDSADAFWHLGMQDKSCLSDFLDEMLERQYKIQTEINHLKLNMLTSERMDQVSNLLCPLVMPNEFYAHLILSQEEAKRRAGDNLRILDGLKENKRLLIQGPPGSGKSSYALSTARRKSREGVGKMLYLCWNELLASYNRYKLQEEGVDQAEAWAFYRFVLHLMQEAGMDPDTLTVEKLKEPGALLKQVHIALDYLESQGKNPVYDYIIIDEAQDLFSRGIDEVVDRLAAHSDGLKKGNYIVFYDNSQAYRQAIEESSYMDALGWFKEYAAIYQLYHRYRGTAGDGLYEFITDLNQRNADLQNNYGKDVIIKKWKDENELERLLDKTISEVKQRAGWKSEQLVLLFSSNMVSGLTDKQRPFDELMNSKSDYLRINTENLCSKSELIKFTTALTYKGLERDIVILLLKDIANPKSDIMHQMLIGASRARIRLYVLWGE
jgi:hypothetical protein